MRAIVAFVGVAIGMVLMGCGGGGGKTAKVTGKITLDNVPIEFGSVVMITDDGKHSSAGPIGAGGQYTVAEAPIGNVKITLSLPPRMEEIKLPDSGDAPKKKDEDPKGVVPKGVDVPKELQSVLDGGSKLLAKVPPVYLNPARSPLRFAVKAGENQHDIQLSTEAGGDAPTLPGAPGLPGGPPGAPPMPPGPPK